MSTEPAYDQTVTPPEPAVHQVRQWLDLIKHELRALGYPFPAIQRELLQASEHIEHLTRHLSAIANLVKEGPGPVAGEVDARHDPDRLVDDLPEGCPWEVWTLHLVPGRLDDRPLAVRRRVLSCTKGHEARVEVELGHGSVKVDLAALKERGRARNRGDALEGMRGYEPLLWVYLNCPDEDERRAWRERRRRERAALIQRTITFWTTVPNTILSALDIAVPCTGERVLFTPSGLDEFDSRASFRVTWNEGDRREQAYVDLLELVDEGSVRDDDPCGGPLWVFFWQRPDWRTLQRIGRERRARWAATQKQAQFNWSRQHDRERSVTTPDDSRNGCQALRDLALDARSSAEEVRRAFRQKVYEQRAHPDQGGTHEQMLRWIRIKDAALKAVMS